VRVKVLLLSAVVASVSVSACNKAPAGQAAASGATPPAATGQGSGTPPGAPAPPAPPKPVPAVLPAVVARVNGEDIKKEDFEKMIKTIEANNGGRTIPPDRRDQILRELLDQLVVYTLLNQEAKTRGLTATDAEIDAKLQQVRQQFPTQEAFEKALQERNITVEGFKHDARMDVNATKVMEAELSTIPGPSDAEAKDFYTKNPNEFKEEESVRASHILIRVDPSADAATKAKAKATIDGVLKKAKAGQDFAKLAQQYSQDGSAAQGGDLDFFPRAKMVPEFSTVAFGLQKDQISDVVTTQFGYHIIKVTDRKPGRVVPFEEAAGQIKGYLERQKKQEKQNTFVEGLKKKAKIEVLI